MQSLPRVIVVDCRCQYTLLQQRILREHGVRAAVVTPKQAAKFLADHDVDAIILSGGEASVTDPDAPQPPEEIFEATCSDGRPVPIFATCYSMQWLAHKLGGKVERIDKLSEYGKAGIRLLEHSNLFEETPVDQDVWGNHGDSVTVVPAGFTVKAHSKVGGIAAMEDPVRRFYCVQFHPEVKDTPYGPQIYENFLFKIADCKRDWLPDNMILATQEDIAAKMRGGKAIIGASGGVDSTTAIGMLAPLLADDLQCVTVDMDQFREDEIEKIKKNVKLAGGTNHRIIDAKAKLAEAMMGRDSWWRKLLFGLIAFFSPGLAEWIFGVVDAEKKRKVFKRVYLWALMRAAREFSAGFVIQGTLAPDRIESGATGGALIKSHHNVGLDFGQLIQLHPLEHLFKYEVRGLAQALGLPESIWNRQPFPGPGLPIRILGKPTTPARLDLLRWADARVTEILIKRNLYNEISQLVVALNCVDTVGVKGSARAHGPSIVVRAVKTVDFMTAEGIRLSPEAKDEIESVLCQHRGIIRVWYDEMDKPPATTEME